MRPAGREAYFHGEQVAVATLTMARIQDEVLAGEPPCVRPDPITCAELQRRFGAEIGASCWREFAAKQMTPEAEAKLERRLADAWDDVRYEIGHGMIRADRIHAVLQRAGCPTSPEQIGLTSAFYTTAVRNARFLRDRYTFLDLADDSGHRAVMGLTRWDGANSG